MGELFLRPLGEQSFQSNALAKKRPEVVERFLVRLDFLQREAGHVLSRATTKKSEFLLLGPVEYRKGVSVMSDVFCEFFCEWWICDGVTMCNVCAQPVRKAAPSKRGSLCERCPEFQMPVIYVLIVFNPVMEAFSPAGEEQGDIEQGHKAAKSK